MTPPPVIHARGLTKRFGDFTAVDALTFAVEPGSIFAFLGANGSGKSTTIRMLIGLLRPTDGTIEVDGIDVIRSPRRVRDHIGYMGQRVSLYQGLTLRENLEFYAGLYGLAGQELERRWGALRERFALAESEHEKASELPAGVRQRAGLALSTLHRPRVLFLDEPTAGVDIQNRLLFWDLIRDEAEAGVTVFVTTHFLEEVEYCDWVCFIDAGRLIANATPETIRQRYSPGYRVRLDLEAESCAAAVAGLGAAGWAVETTHDGVSLLTPSMDPARLQALDRFVGPAAAGRVRVEQPEMPAVFLRLMTEAMATKDHPPACEGAGITHAASAEARRATTATQAPLDATPHAAAPRRSARWRRLRTLVQREGRATLRDPFTVTILILVPIAALLAFGLTLSTEVKHLRLGVHDANGTSASRRVVAELAANGTFEPRRYATRDALDRALVSGDVSIGIVIPPDFDRAFQKARPGAAAPEIQMLYDGAETVVAGNAEAFAQALIAATGAGLGRDRQGAPRGGVTAAGPPAPHRPDGGIAVTTNVLFNPDLSGTPFMVAGVYGFVLTFLTTLITAVSIVNERLTGTFEQLQVTPATAAEIVLGKILPLGAVFSLDVVLMMLVAGFLLGVWPAGSVIFFVSIASLYVLTSLALGLILSATSATAAAAVQKTVLLGVPLIFLGGFAFPIRNMPAFFRGLAELLPATHFIRISRAIYLRGEGPIALAGEIGMVMLIGAILMTLAFRTVEARQ